MVETLFCSYILQYLLNCMKEVQIQWVCSVPQQSEISTHLVIPLTEASQNFHMSILLYVSTSLFSDLCVFFPSIK